MHDAAVGRGLSVGGWVGLGACTYLFYRIATLSLSHPCKEPQRQVGARIQQMLINPRAQSASHVLSRGTDSPAAAKWPDGVRFCQRFCLFGTVKRLLAVFPLCCHIQKDWLRRRNRKMRQKSTSFNRRFAFSVFTRRIEFSF